jgi:hypothetical protein
MYLPLYPGILGTLLFKLHGIFTLEKLCTGNKDSQEFVQDQGILNLRL